MSIPRNKSGEPKPEKVEPVGEVVEESEEETEEESVEYIDV